MHMKKQIFQQILKTYSLAQQIIQQSQIKVKWTSNRVRQKILNIKKDQDRKTLKMCNKKIHAGAMVFSVMIVATVVISGAVEIGLLIKQLLT